MTSAHHAPAFVLAIVWAITFMALADRFAYPPEAIAI
jgi:hypothetical protein